MKANIALLIPDTFYHIYNRGINGQNIFLENRNYDFFLQKYALFIPPVADTYAYCLLKNHFHLLIRTKPVSALTPLLIKQPGRSVEKILQLPFSHFFNSYAQAINKAYQRSGGLFERPFRRIPVTHTSYLKNVVHYIHANPQRHGMIEDYRDYTFSSYAILHSQRPTKLKRDTVIEWYGGLEELSDFHPDRPDVFRPEFMIESD